MAKLLGGTRIYGNLTVDANLSLTGGNVSTSTTTGALVISSAGGLGVGGSAYIGGGLTVLSANVVFASGTASTNTTTGALVVSGGAGISGALYAGSIFSGGSAVLTAEADTLATVTGRGATTATAVSITNATASTTASTGALVVTGGVGVGGVIQAGGNIVAASTAVSSSKTTGALVVTGGVGVGGTIYADQARITNTADSVSTSTGALVIQNGGLGVAGNVWIGGNLYVANIVSTTYSQLSVNDPLLYLTANTPQPYIYDIGLYSQFVGGPVNAYGHTGIVRQQSANTWVFFSNVKSEPTNTINWADPGIIYDAVKTGDLNIANSTVSSSTTSGALIVSGGAGVGGRLNVGGNVVVSSGAASTSTTTGALVIPSTGGLGVGGVIQAGGNIVTSGNFISTSATNITANNGAFAYGTVSYSDSNVLASFSSNVNGYNQMILQNANNGSSASTNFNVSNDRGNATYYYGEFGMNSSQFSGSSPFSLPNNVYLAAATSDLVIGTYSSNAIKFVINSGANESVKIDTNGNLIVVSSTTSTSTTTGALVVTGGIGVGGVIQAGGNIVAASTAVSSSTTTGALVVKGGLGVAGSIYASSAIITSSAASSDKTSGALVIQNGGLGVGGAVWADSLNAFSYVNVKSSGGPNSYLSTYQFDMGSPSAPTLLSFNISGGYSVDNPGTSQIFLKSSDGSTVDNYMLATPTSIEFKDTATFFTSIGPKLTNTSLDFYNPATGTLVSTLNSTSFSHSGSITTTSTAVSTSTSTGALVVSGGTGIAGRLFVGGNTVIANTTTSTSATTGALVVTGGVGVGGNIYIGGTGLFWSNGASYAASTTPNYVGTANAAIYAQTTAYTTQTFYPTFSNIAGGNTALGVNSGLTFNATSGNLTSAGHLGTHWGAVAATTANVSSGAASTNATTGALVVTGGVGVGGNIYIGGTGLFWSNGASYAASTTPNYVGTANAAIYAQTTAYTTQTFYPIFSNIAGGNTALGVNSGLTFNATSGNLTSPAGLVSTTHWGAVAATTANVSSGAASTSTTTGALVVTGGVGVGGVIQAGGNIVAASTAVSSSTTTGALVVTGGVGVGGNIYIGGTGLFWSNGASYAASTTPNYVGTANAAIYAQTTAYTTQTFYPTFSNIAGGNTALGVNSGLTFNATSGNLTSAAGLVSTTHWGAVAATTANVSSGAASTNATTGALVVTGGVGVGGNIYIGGNILQDTTNSYVTFSDTVSATALGTTQATAYLLNTTSTQFTTSTATNYAARLPYVTPGTMIFIANDSNNVISLYPPGGGVIDQLPINNAANIVALGMWTGIALTSVNWTSLNPDSVGTANQITVTQNSGNVTFALTNDVSIVSNITVGGNIIQTASNAFAALSTTASATAAGTTQATAYLIRTTNTQFTTVAAGSGATLPLAPTGTTIFIANDGANSLNLYPPVGGIIDQLPVNNPATITAGGMWSGVSLNAVNWTTISPDTVGTANQITVTQNSGNVTLALANPISGVNTSNAAINDNSGALSSTAYTRRYGGFANAQVFTTATAANVAWPIPAGVTKLEVTVIGGGGAGGGGPGAAAGAAGGGGGSGAVGKYYFTEVTPGSTLYYSVGVGGSAAVNAAGGSGGQSNVAVTRVGHGANIVISSPGGSGGAVGTASSTNKAGGAGGTISTISGPGVIASQLIAFAGSYGGPSTSTAAIATANGGMGAPGYFGMGAGSGNVASTNPTAGSTGTGAGGGGAVSGAGAATLAGAAGGTGAVIIEF